MRIKKHLSKFAIAVIAISLIAIPTSSVFADIPDNYGDFYYRASHDGFIYIATPSEWDTEEIEEEEYYVDHIFSASDPDSRLRCELYYEYEECDADFIDSDWRMDDSSDKSYVIQYYDEYGSCALFDILENNEDLSVTSYEYGEFIITSEYLSWVRTELYCEDYDGKGYNVISYTRSVDNLVNQVMIFTNPDDFTDDQINDIETVMDNISTDDEYAREKLVSINETENYYYEDDDEDYEYDDSSLASSIYDGLIVFIPAILIIAGVFRKKTKKESQNHVKKSKKEKKTSKVNYVNTMENHNHSDSNQESIPVISNSHYVESLNTLVKSGLLTKEERNEMLKKYYDTYK